jgi:peptidoglycan/LPS O-acetylase OafA/YrhL
MDEKPELDARDCLVLRGLAILAISFHNYCHLLSRVRENEFDFSPQRFLSYLDALHEPSRIFQASFSFLGHYGVQIFVFLSAYGLATRYWDRQPPWTTFVWGRVRKLYPMFLLAIALWALWVGFPQGRMGPVAVVRQQWDVLVLTMLGLVTLLPGYDLPPVGPWWYMPFIMQFYCLWPLFRRFAIRFGRVGLFTLSVAALALTYAINGTLVTRWSINLLHTPVGHLPEACLGVAMARYGYRPGSVAALAAATLFLLGNLRERYWLLAFISALVLMVWIYQGLRPLLRRSKFLVRVGIYSTAIFFVNGFIRLPFVGLGAQADIWYARMLFGVASVGFAFMVAMLLTAVSARLLSQVPLAPLHPLPGGSGD